MTTEATTETPVPLRTFIASSVYISQIIQNTDFLVKWFFEESPEEIAKINIFSVFTSVNTFIGHIINDKLANKESVDATDIHRLLNRVNRRIIMFIRKISAPTTLLQNMRKKEIADIYLNFVQLLMTIIPHDILTSDVIVSEPEWQNLSNLATSSSTLVYNIVIDDTSVSDVSDEQV